MTAPAGTTVWMVSPEGRRWEFDPGSLSLAFCYSGDFGYDVDAWERLRTPADLDAWLSERFGPARCASDGADYDGARQLRAAITSAARDAASGRALDAADVDTINLWAARPAVPPHLAGGTGEPLRPAPSQMLATIARDAVHSLGEASGMIRECAADDCHLIFLDTSRPRNRRWCSMSRCGGRAKARTHYVRHLTGDNP